MTDQLRWRRSAAIAICVAPAFCAIDRIFTACAEQDLAVAFEDDRHVRPGADQPVQDALEVLVRGQVAVHEDRRSSA